MNSAVLAKRRARRADQHADELHRLKTHKKRVISNAMRKNFRKTVHEVKDERGGIWKLVRWGKKRSHLPPELPVIFNLKREGTVASTFEDKAAMLGSHFFTSIWEETTEQPQETQTETHPRPIAAPDRLQQPEVAGVINKLKRKKTPDVDGIPGEIIKAMGEPMAHTLTSLTQACWDWEYHPRIFKRARTVVLRKMGKEDYSKVNA